MNGIAPELNAVSNSRLPASFVDLLRARFGERVYFDEPISRHTSFRIGGPADAWVNVETVAELSEVRVLSATARQPVFLLGSGTNVLVADRGMRGVVLHLGRGFAFAEWDERAAEAWVRVGAGMPFKKLVYDAIGRGWEGLEFGEGIPGSLGGGLMMNAGAFGGEIGRVVEVLEGVDAQGKVQCLARAELPFTYRRLDLPGGFVITAVRLRLSRGDGPTIALRVAAARSKRKSRQPLGLPNAGSVFKNPAGRFAGGLLEEAGVKGLMIGSAKVSERHANFIVNAGGARADDVRQLMAEMQRRVLEQSGIELEPELKMVGDW